MNITNDELIGIIREELESVLDEKKGSKRLRKKKAKKKAKKKLDRCARIAKRKYKVWPSAYASGAAVKCRKGKIWKGLKEALTEQDFVPHMMYNPKTEQKEKAETHDRHLELAKQGYTHVDPEELRGILRDEGGAAGLDPLVKGTEASEEEVQDTLDKMPDARQHEDEDYILTDKDGKVPEKSASEEDLDEKKKKPCKKAKGKRYVKRVNGKCRSYGQAGKAKSGGDRIRPGTKKGDAYCARSAKIKKCKNPPCANDLSRKKWKCRGNKSMKSE
jgi:hypothetical protein